ncbi:hypothetical protein B5D80_25845 [Micromonospora wenchangensis]|uniref:Uncharacterized protein n=1 Tax=Micromonospora wenchangensis TaxID=1185415 RepID=A0A246RFJ9_9ACTN|nr:hypothetical protein [Micromonospora wenchangensis]OWV01625.1 hypothetical protein B5D80_25845 [Micromonospora wenchangensis]
MSAKRFIDAYQQWRDAEAAATVTGTTAARQEAERQRRALHDSAEAERARRQLNGRAAPRDRR